MADCRGDNASPTVGGELKPEIDPTPAATYRRSDQSAPPDPRRLPLAGIGSPRAQAITDFFAPDPVPGALSGYLADSDLYVVEFYCSLRPVKGAIRWARFMVRWESEADATYIRAVDIYPRETIRTAQRDVKVSVGPELKFREIGMNLGGMQSGLEYTEIQPIVSGTGIREPIVSWDYRPAHGVPVAGSKYMYAIIETAKGAPAGHASIDLAVDLGGLRAFLPKSKSRAGCEAQIWSSPPPSLPPDPSQA